MPERLRQPGMSSVRTVTLGLSLALALSIPGCSVGESDGSSGSLTGATLLGTGMRGPDLTGAWHLEVTVTRDDCHVGPVPVAGEGVLQITQIGTALQMTVVSPCGILVSGGTGTLRSGELVSATYDRTLVVSGTCSLDLHEVQTGLLSGDRDTVSGSHTLTVTPVGDCLAGLACEIEGTFLAERCPPADCSLRDCGPAAPATGG